MISGIGVAESESVSEPKNEAAAKPTPTKMIEKKRGSRYFLTPETGGFELERGFFGTKRGSPCSDSGGSG